MKREHVITEVEREFFRLVREEEARLRRDYLAALGAAKEAEIASAALAASRDQQLEIIAKNGALGPGRVTFSSDGLRLIVEPIEQPAAGFDECMARADKELAAMRQPAATGPELVNGAAHHGN